jgi:amidase
VVPSLDATGFLSAEGTTLEGLFELNVRREAAAKQYLHLFLDNNIDAILMAPAPHTAVPLDTWTTATYTCLWNYLDYPAVVIPVDKVRESDVADDVTHARYGIEDARVYSLCTYNWILFPVA